MHITECRTIRERGRSQPSDVFCAQCTVIFVWYYKMLGMWNGYRWPAISSSQVLKDNRGWVVFLCNISNIRCLRKLWSLPPCSCVDMALRNMVSQADYLEISKIFSNLDNCVILSHVQSRINQKPLA